MFLSIYNKSYEFKKVCNNFGKGKEKRDLLYIDDFTNFIHSALNKKKFRIYNCGSGEFYQ